MVGQNLIPNGNFESGSIPCENTGERHEGLVDNWYAATGSSLYYKRNECDSWFSSTPVLNGTGGLLIRGETWINGLMVSDFVVNDFLEPLEEGCTYYLEFYGKSYTIQHPSEEALRDCLIRPSRDITFYLGDENDAFGIETTWGEHLRTDAWKIGDYEKIAFNGRIQIESNETAWQKYTTCIKAKGGESKLGVSGPIRFIEGAPPCELVSDEALDTFSVEAFTTNRFFHFFYYEIDNIALYKIPEKLTVIDTICQYQFNTVNLFDLVPDSPIFEEVTFLWEDGNGSAIREFEDGGTYNIEVILPCITIPLQLEIQTITCPSPVYIPNTFSPNLDGINDVFRPYFNATYQLNYYQLTIFDRWGNLIFTSNDAMIGWDGFVVNQKSNADTYLYNLEYQFVGFSRRERRTGSLQLIN